MDRLTWSAPDLLTRMVSVESRALLGFTLRTDVSSLGEISYACQTAASQAEESCTPDDAIGSYRRLRQLEALMKKNPALPGTDPSMRKSNALSIFYRMEKQCARSNRRVAHYASRPDRLKKYSPTLQRLFAEARWEIYKLLGPGPTADDIDDFNVGCNFGRGTSGGLESSSMGSTDVDLYAKLCDDTTLCYTPDLLDWYGPILLKGAFGRDIWRRHSFGVLRECCTRANKVITVPKDCDKDRVIAVEPLLNMYCQQGWKHVLTRKLRDWGVTLEDQTRNRSLAREASLLGFSPASWSTIDLSSASDTVCTELVRWFLPKGWYDVLDSVRCKYGLVDGVEIPYSKFSSMGNATTFPLQCLLFGSLIRAARRIFHESLCYRVYGDDLIVPVSCTLVVIEALKFLGFTPNVHKTYVTGHFRESCGGDYLFGQDVRPIYLKGPLNHPTAIYGFFNALQKLNPHHPLLWVLYESVTKPLIGPEVRDSTTDGHFVAPVWVVRQIHGRERPRRTSLPLVVWSESSGQFKLRDFELDFQVSGWKLPTWVRVAKQRTRHDPFARYLASLFGSYKDSHGVRGTSVPRRRAAHHVVWEQSSTWLGWHLASWDAG